MWPFLFLGLAVALGIGWIVTARAQARRIRALERSKEEIQVEETLVFDFLHGLGEAFGHATGHGLGLEVHEEPRIGRPVRGQTELIPFTDAFVPEVDLQAKRVVVVLPPAGNSDQAPSNPSPSRGEDGTPRA